MKPVAVSMRSWTFLFMLFILVSCHKDNFPGTADAEPPAIPAHPLNGQADLDLLLQEIGNARIVLLGEASHGTSEFYTWRTAISRRLIEEKGFDFIAVEGEWADSYRVNQFVKGVAKDSAAAVALLRQYDRWPTWMWGNHEVASLVTWMNGYNQSRAEGQKAGFYGLDVYCLWESMTELMPYLQGADASVVKAAQEVHQCFRPFSADPQQYAYEVANASASCRAQTEGLWNAVMQMTGGTTAKNEASFVMQQNALVALNGERYYRAMLTGDHESWNIRDRHMAQTIRRLLELHGPDAKIIVWEHNTHVGDARYTDMAGAGLVNVGELVREEYGRENVYSLGFGTYEGSVIASERWGAPIRTMNVPPAQSGSWEHLLHRQSATDKLLLSRELRNQPQLMKAVGHRAIGVVYQPGNERGNYVPSIIPDRYDAFIFLDRTTALHPIGTPARREPPDTYPSGY